MLDRMRLPKFRYVISAGAILGFAIHVEHRLECPFICHRLHIILVTRLGVACSADIFARWNNDLTTR